MATLDFGGVRPGTFGPDITQNTAFNDLPSFAGGILKDIPVDANMTVTITGDTSHFQVRDIFIMEWVLKEVDPGELPLSHHGPLPKVKTLEVVQQTDGTSSVALKKGQKVLVRVQYAALN